MQPYFLPYIGYFQLLAAVDKFVVFDDVNFINRGWINRNRLLINGNAVTFTIPLHNSSQNRLIVDTQICNDTPWQKKLLKMFQQAYCRAKNFEQTTELLDRVVNFPDTRLNAFLLNSLRLVAEHLDINTNIIASSSIYGNSHLKAQDRIIDICLKEQAAEYVNLSGGLSLYHRTDFQRQDIELSFIKSQEIPYAQGKCQFIPWLSIVDVLMFNSKDDVKQHLLRYDRIG